MNNNQSGYWAEFIARNYMRLKGYRIIAKNYITGKGTHAGEIDFIAKKSNNLIFVEVKKRSSLENAIYAIKPVQQQRIRNAAQAFIAHNPQFQNYSIRFDAILIAFPYHIKHITNAW